MTREEHLAFCKKCQNRKFDTQQGIICGITNEKAAFEVSCNDFLKDETVQDEILKKEFVENSSIDAHKIKDRLPNEALDQMRIHQDILYAFIGGLASALLGAAIWALITVALEYQIGWMAIGIGILVGISVRFFGSGIDPVFGIIGGFFALISCLLGNIVSQAAFIAQSESLGVFEVLGLFGLEGMITIAIESFEGIDILFYFFAIAEGYKFAFRRVNERMLRTMDFTPLYSKLRFPLTIASVIIIGLVLFFIKNMGNGTKTFYDDEGNKTVEGQIENGMAEGFWKYFYANGNLYMTGHYKRGLEYGEWSWFDDQSRLTKVANYKSGLFHGTVIQYYEGEQMMDSGRYELGRKHGPWKYWNANGTLGQTGSYQKDYQEGTWIFYHENGKISEELFYEKPGVLKKSTSYDYEGNTLEVLEYDQNQALSIMQSWNENQEQTVINGTGVYYRKTGSLEEVITGNVRDGKHVGKWKKYFPDGKLEREFEFRNDTLFILNMYDSTGKQQIVDGNGWYKTYYSGTTAINESGKIVGGKREEEWTIYYADGKTISQTLSYHNGLLEGVMSSYFFNEILQSEGNMVNDNREGEWNWYHENGELQSQVTYHNGKKTGTQSFYSESGILVKEEYYEDGELSGEKLIEDTGD